MSIHYVDRQQRQCRYIMLRGKCTWLLYICSSYLHSARPMSSAATTVNPFGIRNTVHYEIVVEKSVFKTIAYPCISFDRGFRRMKDDFFDAKASHNCYAFVGRDGSERSSDDGEPSGTAGRPMLSSIKNENLCDVFVVVVRYYGGKQLGTGGLSRAYATAARDCLKLCDRFEIFPLTRCRVEILISDSHHYHNLVSSLRNVTTLVEDYHSDGTRLAVEIEMYKNDFDGFEKSLVERTKGRALVFFVNNVEIL